MRDFPAFLSSLSNGVKLFSYSARPAQISEVNPDNAEFRPMAFIREKQKKIMFF